jgi:ABC-type transport system involved in cytochrome c biogenesis permease subunit
MDEREWTATMLARCESDEAIFRTMLHDLYQNGQVLQRRKYRFLGYAYRLFVVGLVVTLAVFAAELVAGY